MLPFFFRRRSKPRQSAALMGRATVDAMLPEYRHGFDQDYANLIKNLNEDPNWSSAEFALEAMIYILHCLDIAFSSNDCHITRDRDASASRTASA